MHKAALQAPFPWFGGKRLVAAEVWRRFGNVRNYVEPFFGSGAVLLGAPWPANRIETINDIDGYVSNFWRAIAADPEGVAHYADWPVCENDLHARHAWLVGRRDGLQARLEGDPEFYDAKVAGWWCWGLCCWIGGGWCSGLGPWHVRGGVLAREQADGAGVERKRVALGKGGRGVQRRRVVLGGRGVGPGVLSQKSSGMEAWFCALAERMRGVRVCCGDWSRVCGPAVTCGHGLTGVFLDPPYGGAADRDDALYRCEDTDVAAAAREWAVANGENPLLRIALCGYEGEHELPGEWACFEWQTQGGMGNRGERGRRNRRRERIWFSPSCERQAALWDEVGA